MGSTTVHTTDKHQEEGVSFDRICELSDKHYKRERKRKTKRKSIYSKAILSGSDATKRHRKLPFWVSNRVFFYFYFFPLVRQKEKENLSNTNGSSPLSRVFCKEKKLLHATVTLPISLTRRHAY